MKIDEGLIDWLGLKHRRSGDGFMSYCPFHNGGEDTPPMGINYRDGVIVYHCFACDASGKLPNLVAHVKGVSYEKAVELLEKKFFIDDFGSTEQKENLKSIVKDIPKWEERGEKELTLPDSLLDIYDIPDPTGYMKKRGISAETLKRNEIGYDRWKERVTFPVRNAEGRLFGVVGRTVKNVEPKYEFYDNFKKSHVLYGMHQVLSHGPVVVCEGHLTKLWIEQSANTPNVVALQGCLCSAIQANWLAENAGEIVLFLDNDKAGRHGEELICNLLKDRIRKIYRVPWEDLPDSEGADAANLNAEGVRGMIENKKFSGVRTYL
jgi:DNA primase